MAFRFGDPGGRLYGTVGAGNINQLAWWNGINSNIANFILQVGGSRTSGSCIRFTPPGSGTGVRYMSVSLSAQATWGIAFAFRFNNVTSSNGSLFALVDGATLQCDLRLNTDGTLSVTRNGTILGTTTLTLTVNTYVHIEWKTVIHGSAGTSEIRVNGVPWLVLSAKNTQNTANASANVIALGYYTNVSLGATVNFDWDDVIIWDGQTTDPQGNPDISDFIGDCGLAWLLPNSDGATTQFSKDSGTNNYLRVNEATPDGDTSYTFDNTVNHIDTYAMANLPAGATGVKSLMAVSYMRKDDVGTRMVAPMIRTNTTNFVGPTVSLPGGYSYYNNNWGQNPSGTPTPTPWTVTDVNNIEGGLKVIS